MPDLYKKTKSSRIRVHPPNISLHFAGLITLLWGLVWSSTGTATSPHNTHWLQATAKRMFLKKLCSWQSWGGGWLVSASPHPLRLQPFETGAGLLWRLIPVPGPWAGKTQETGVTQHTFVYVVSAACCLHGGRFLMWWPRAPRIRVPREATETQPRKSQCITSVHFLHHEQVTEAWSIFTEKEIKLPPPVRGVSKNIQIIFKPSLSFCIC